MGNEVKYYNVTFNDANNGAKKTYKIQEGAKITLTKSVYTISKDCTIDVTLPQYTAANIFDVNKDGKIDKADSKIYLDQPDDKNTSEVDALNLALSKSLDKAGSKYYIEGNGGGNYCGVHENGFRTTFVNGTPEDANFDRKEFGITFPED